MSQQTQAGEILGTPNYMSPEQVMGKKVDGRSDLFSLGIILYELATGGRPFKGDNFATIFKSIIDDEPEAPIKGNPELPTDLSDSIMRSLKKEPEKRYQAGGEMVKAFKRIEKDTELPPVMEKQVTVNKGNHRAVMLIVLVIIITVIAAGTVYFVFAARKDRVSVEPVKKETTVITPKQNDQAKEVEKAQGAGETKKEELPTANIPMKESSTPEVNKEEKKIATESKLKKSSTKKTEKASAPNKKESQPKSDTDKTRGTPSAPGASQVDNQKTKHLPRESSPPGKNEPENKFQKMKRLQKEYNETKDPSLLEEIERLKRDFYM
jgi:serine/threonine protein kinase